MNYAAKHQSHFQIPNFKTLKQAIGEWRRNWRINGLP